MWQAESSYLSLDGQLIILKKYIYVFRVRLLLVYLQDVSIHVFQKLAVSGNPVSSLT